MPARPVYAAAESRVEWGAMLLLLALIPLRTALNETHSFETLRMFRGLGGSPGTQPGMTFFIVAVIAAVAAVVAFARLRRGAPRYRWTGAELGAALLLIAAVISTWRAGQKHLALIGTLDLLGMVLYLLTLRQLLTRPWHVRLAMSVILATGLMVVAKCGYQRWVEFPATIKYYEEHKADYVESPTGSPGDVEAAGLAYDYEQRLRGQLVSGYFGHSNILGSYLILVICAALAVASARFRRLPGWTMVFPLLVCAGSVWALVCAQSKGAAAACVIAVLAWLIGQWMSRARAGAAIANPQSLISNRLWLLVWLALVIGAVALVGVLAHKPDALGRSMLFRMTYWRGAAEMVREQGWLGVGADNFGRFFSRYKPLECPEDVQSPHSWVVQMGTEWGVLGLAGMLLMFVGVSRGLGRGENAAVPLATAPPGPSSERPAPKGPETSVADRQRRMVASCMVVIAVIAFGWLGWLVGWTTPELLFITLAVALVPWLLGFLGTAIEATTSTEFADDWPGPLLAGLCAGLIGFVIHTGVDLAMFHPGAATTFFALLAVALATREFGVRSPQPWLRGTFEIGNVPASERSNGSDGKHEKYGFASESVSASERTPWPRPGAPVSSASLALRLGTPALSVGFAAAAIAILAALAWPAAELGENLHAGRQQSKERSSWEAYEVSSGYRAYRQAVDDYRLDGCAIEELIDQMAPRVTDARQVDALLELAREYRRRDPWNSSVSHEQAMLHFMRSQLTGNLADLDLAIADLRAEIAAYPTAPAKRIALGDLLARQADATGSAEARRAAAAEYQKALDLDDQRIYVSQPHRMPKEKRAEVQERIKALLARPG